MEEAMVDLVMMVVVVIVMVVTTMMIATMMVVMMMRVMMVVVNHMHIISPDTITHSSAHPRTNLVLAHPFTYSPTHSHTH